MAARHVVLAGRKLIVHVYAVVHKVIQCNRVRRYAQGTYNQDHVSYLPAMPDTRLWKDGAADCEMWDGHHHGFP
ncbi:hypothetical protein TIFTF001_039213 [Ficus carica]|uniref:Uncharacterized protein n=1 Tax=Ficus carica TaxID=3494 RepID=A0AA88E8T1_FICCA|nr:hypothetical protein TIFTF001_039213 [Ficus carica]